MTFSLMNTLKTCTIFFCVVSLFLISSVSAQQNDTINGSVIDSLFNSAIDSVNVSSEGISVKTNTNGTFSLIVSSTHTLNSPAAQELPHINWNPNTSLMYWSGLTRDASITILDVRGRVAVRCIAAKGSGMREFSLSKLPEGMYLITISVNNQTYVYKYLHYKNTLNNSYSTIVLGSGISQSTMAKVAVTKKSHVVICTKTGYKPDTMTIAAGTPGSTSAAIKMIGANIPDKAMETVRIQADGNPVTFKTSLVNGEVYLLKACGSLSFSTYDLDAEFGSFTQGTSIKDSVGTADIGIDIGVKCPRVLTGVTQGRMRWFGGYRTDHIYYMTVTGLGQPLTLKLVKSTTETPLTGAITISLVKLSPYPQTFSKRLDSISVPVTNTLVHSNITPVKSTIYLLTAGGSGHVGGAGLGDGDAEYMDYTATGTGQEDVGDYSIDYGLGVDDTAITSKIPRTYWWGPWRKDHIYYMLYAGTGKTISFLYFDAGYADNSTTSKLAVQTFAAP